MATAKQNDNQGDRAVPSNITLYPDTEEIIGDVNAQYFGGRNKSAAIRYIIHDWIKIRDVLALTQSH